MGHSKRRKYLIPECLQLLTYKRPYFFKLQISHNPASIHFMKRFILFLMIFIAPMQMAWANIACYSHTQVLNTHFVVAHDHEHCVSHTHSHDFIEYEVSKTSGDEHSAHCDACHAHSSTVVQNDFIWFVFKDSHSYLSVNHFFLTLASAEAPYRPKWL